MEKENIYISFHEWNNSRLNPKPKTSSPKASLVSCPVTTLSISDLGKEINKIKKARQTRTRKKKKASKSNINSIMS
jgi:hypothetical protein